MPKEKKHVVHNKKESTSVGRFFCDLIALLNITNNGNLRFKRAPYHLQISDVLEAEIPLIKFFSTPQMTHGVSYKITSIKVRAEPAVKYQTINGITPTVVNNYISTALVNNMMSATPAPLIAPFMSTSQISVNGASTPVTFSGLVDTISSSDPMAANTNGALKYYKIVIKATPVAQ